LEFLHADELGSRYGVKGVPLPAVFEREGEGLRVLISADAVNECASMDELKRLILKSRAGATEGS
jgi:hypothetical protein